MVNGKDRERMSDGGKGKRNGKKRRKKWKEKTLGG